MPKRLDPCCIAAAMPLRVIVGNAIYPAASWFANIIDRARALDLELTELDISEVTSIVHFVDAHGCDPKQLVEGTRFARMALLAHNMPTPSELKPCAGCGREDRERRPFTRDRIPICIDCILLPRWKDVLERDAREQLGIPPNVDVEVVQGRAAVQEVVRKLSEIAGRPGELSCQVVDELTGRLLAGTAMLDEGASTKLQELAKSTGLDKVEPALGQAQLFYAVHQMSRHGMDAESAALVARNHCDAPKAN